MLCHISIRRVHPQNRLRPRKVTFRRLAVIYTNDDECSHMEQPIGGPVDCRSQVREAWPTLGRSCGAYFARPAAIRLLTNKFPLPSYFHWYAQATRALRYAATHLCDAHSWVAAVVMNEAKTARYHKKEASYPALSQWFRKGEWKTSRLAIPHCFYIFSHRMLAASYTVYPVIC